MAACICLRLGAPRQCGRVRNGITRERARNVFGETRRIVGSSDCRIVGSSDRRPRAGDFWCNPNVHFHNVVACVSGVWRESFLGFGATPRTSTHNSVCRRISTHICAYLHILVRICVYRPIAHTYTKHPRARFASLSVWHGSITPKIPPSTRARGCLV